MTDNQGERGRAALWRRSKSRLTVTGEILSTTAVSSTVKPPKKLFTRWRQGFERALYASDRPGGAGARDLWNATRSSVTGTWSTPVNLGRGRQLRVRRKLPVAVGSPEQAKLQFHRPCRSRRPSLWWRAYPGDVGALPAGRRGYAREPLHRTFDFECKRRRLRSNVAFDVRLGVRSRGIPMVVARASTAALARAGCDVTVT